MLGWGGGVILSRSAKNAVLGHMGVLSSLVCEAIADVQLLKQLHCAAIQVPSLEAFSNLLDDPA